MTVYFYNDKNVLIRTDYIVLYLFLIYFGLSIWITFDKTQRNLPRIFMGGVIASILISFGLKLFGRSY